ncbi:MATE family efflux transporter [Clostridium gelidum]|uniref:Multidrug export protein MepA n=1 Tax=Clostridium gelidum TaxID=704125 RepID=A0ABM7T1C3_9CLOT|nr:MATE family efflux transporter [Clostridium gelidum]BCZ45707.1 MATE family efflux transporter [Clostridium gelidum]
MNKTEQLKTFPINNLILSLSGPAIFAFIVSTLNLALDRIFLAKSVGTVALAAVSIALGIQMLIQAFAQLIASGASSSIAIELGKNNKNYAQRIIGNAFILGIIMSIIITIVGCVFVKPILILYAATAESMDYAMPYTIIMILSTIFFISSQVLNNIIRGMGYSKKATFNFLSSIITHGILNAIFLFVFHMGIRSVAVASGIGYLVSCILAAQFLINGKCVARLRTSFFKLEKWAVKRILTVGVSALVMQMTVSVISMVFNHVSNKYGGSKGQAAYGIIYTLLMMIYMPIMGLGQGIQSIIGINYGAELKARVKETLIKAIKYATIFAVFMFIIMELFSNSIALIFGGANDHILAQMTSNGIRIVGLSISAIGFQLIGASYFQYVGKVKQSVLLSALRQFVLLIPLAIILPIFLGISGVFASFVVADILSFGVTLVFVIKELRRLDVLIDLPAENSNCKSTY